MPEETDTYAHERAIAAEIRLLFDHIGGNANLRIGDLKIPDLDGKSPLTLQDALERLSEIEQKLTAARNWPAPPTSPVTAPAGAQGSSPQPPAAQSTAPKRAISGADEALLYLLRDGLNALAQPASGRTVAYTTMTATMGRGDHGAGGPRRQLALEAYPALVYQANLHRKLGYCFLVFALLATGFAVWEATKVALGKSLLASLHDLRTQQTELNLEKGRLEAQEGTSKEWNAPTFWNGNSLRACENPSYRYFEMTEPEKTTLDAWAAKQQKIEQAKAGTHDGVSKPPRGQILIFKTPVERDICDRDTILAGRFGLFYEGLKQYRTDWPSLVGLTFKAAEAVVDALLYVPRRVSGWLTSLGSGGAPQPAGSFGNDVEWVVVAQLLVLGNYVLPVIFALLGAAAYVMVDYFAKVRNALLSPIDLPLAAIRVVLGLVVGACIGLIYSSGVPIAQATAPAPGVNSLASALSLSASGIAFLAGFGVEGVFTMLEAVVRRVFPAS